VSPSEPWHPALTRRQVLTGEDWNTILYDGIIAYQVSSKGQHWL
jgi:hypothetical protein